jgi:hypothetical protein
VGAIGDTCGNSVVTIFLLFEILAIMQNNYGEKKFIGPVKGR